MPPSTSYIRIAATMALIICASIWVHLTPHSERPGALVTGALFALALLAYHIFTWYMERYRRLVFLTGRQTTGRVTAKVTPLRGFGYRISVHYVVDDFPVTASARMDDRYGFRVHVGDEIPIIVDPKNPRCWLPDVEKRYFVEQPAHGAAQQIADSEVRRSRKA